MVSTEIGVRCEVALTCSTDLMDEKLIPLDMTRGLLVEILSTLLKRYGL